MKAEIITIGDEILIGQIVDTNSAWLGTKLGDAGIRVLRITSVSDSAAEITSAVNDAMRRADVVITTGGLGPTKDDITKHTLAAIFHCPLVMHRESFENIREMLEIRGFDFNELNQGQAMVPSCCQVMMNLNGTAPGMWFEHEGTVLASMPGVPFEMMSMTEEELLPRLKSHFNLGGNIHKTLLTFGLAESALAQKISKWEDALPGHIHLAYLPSAKGVRLRLSIYEASATEAMGEIEREFSKLENLIPQNMVGYGETSLEQAVGEMLRTRGLSVAVAESCTGGNIAHRFTVNPGASDYFAGGVVAYSNQVKVSLLNVCTRTLAVNGAVSRETAEQMALGIREATGATYGISTTGIAGPDGGTDQKPVGTVWIALATPDGVSAEKFVFGSIREQNIERASSNAINMLRLLLI